MAIVESAVRNMDNHKLVTLYFGILFSSNKNPSGDIASWNDHRPAERFVIQPFAGITGNQIIHGQSLGMVTRTGNHQTCPVIAWIVLLLPRHSIHSCDADDRQFIINDQDLHLNRCRHQKRLVRCHREDEVFDSLNVLILVGPNHDQSPGLTRFKGEVVWNFNIVQIVFSTARNDIRNLQCLADITHPHHFHDGHIAAILAGKLVDQRDCHQRQSERVIILNTELEFPGAPRHPVVGGLIIVCLLVNRTGVPTRRGDLPCIGDYPRTNPEHNLLGAFENCIIHDLKFDLHLIQACRKVELAVCNIGLGVTIKREVRLILSQPTDNIVHLKRSHQTPGTCHLQKCRK